MSAQYVFKVLGRRSETADLDWEEYSGHRGRLTPVVYCSTHPPLSRKPVYKDSTLLGTLSHTSVYCPEPILYAAD